MRTKTRGQLPHFATSEVLAGCGLTKRDFEYLAREGLSPQPIQEGGKGQAQLFDFSAISWFAMTGLFLTVGFPLAASANASGLFVESLGASSLDNDSGWHAHRVFRNYEQSLPAAERKALSNDGNGYSRPHLHEALRRTSPAYQPYMPHRGDIRLHIADGTHVQYSGLLAFALPNGGTRKLMPLFQLERQSNLRRSTPRLISVRDRIEQRAWPETEVFAEFDAVFAKAVARTELNIELAIRNALDRIYDARHGLAGGQ